MRAIKGDDPGTSVTVSWAYEGEQKVFLKGLECLNAHADATASPSASRLGHDGGIPNSLDLAARQVPLSWQNSGISIGVGDLCHPGRPDGDGQATGRARSSAAKLAGSRGTHQVGSLAGPCVGV